jgi:gluconolactonase
MSVEIRDKRFANVVGSSLTFECLADNFLFTEGPVWDAAHSRLIFSDIPADTMYQWTRSKGVEEFRKPSNKSNGLTWDREGRLLSCEHATSRVTRLEANGQLSVIASTYNGLELNSPNDIVVKSDGAIYFTDPTYGRMEYYGLPREPQLRFRAVYRLDLQGDELTLLDDDFSQPNGLCFSSDERLMYVNDTERGHIRVFDVRKDGTLAGGRIFAQLIGEGAGAPDGMKIDSDGNLYCCGPGGIHVFDSLANCLGVIRVPTPAANFNWGGDDLRSLFITASASLYRIDVRVPGQRVQPGVAATATP